MVLEIPLRRRFDVESMIREMDLLWDTFFLKGPTRKVRKERRCFLSIDLTEAKEIAVKTEAPKDGKIKPSEVHPWNETEVWM